MSEARCSIVTSTHSNVASGSAEPLCRWRRQYQHTTMVNGCVGLSGVSGKTCGEGHSREDGRSDAVRNATLHTSIKRASESQGSGAACKERSVINVTREVHSHAVSEVRGAYSSDEAPVMGGDAKRPHFDGGIEAVNGSPIRVGVVYGR